jgi:hypothetical protein
MTQFTKLKITRLTIAISLVIAVGLAQAEVPVVQSPEVIELEFGQPFEYTLKASNEPLGFSIKGLPFWLEREGDILRGTPVSLKEHTLTLYALNAEGISEPRKVKLQIADTTTGSIVEAPKSKN